SRVTPTADEPQETADLDAPATPPDRRVDFSEVAQAVDVAAGRAEAPPVDEGPDHSQDLLPHKLPKRGRRNSRLQKPWSREKPAQHAPPVAAPPVAAPEFAPPTVDPNAARIAPPAPPSTDPGAVRFGPTTQPAPEPPVHEEEVTPSEAPASAEAPSQGSQEKGDDRFAFFTAFRDAAERAREEAGIDDRRVGR